MDDLSFNHEVLSESASDENDNIFSLSSPKLVEDISAEWLKTN